MERDEREAEARTMPIGGNTRKAAWAAMGRCPAPLPICTSKVVKGRTMILKCDCVNSTADTLYGQGRRPHSALVKFCDRPVPRRGVKPEHEEYCCDYCSYVRTKAKGAVTGAK